ncbi:hypothetical protein ACLOJK_000112 [Asimina triloba]
MEVVPALLPARRPHDAAVDLLLELTCDSAVDLIRGMPTWEPRSKMGWGGHGCLPMLVEDAATGVVFVICHAVVRDQGNLELACAAGAIRPALPRSVATSPRRRPALMITP